MNLLLVEDDPDIRSVIELSLSLDPAFSVTSFVSAEDALIDIAMTDKVFEAALLDYQLPGMNGIELHRRLVGLSAMTDIMTLLITAQIDDDHVRSYRSSGISGVIAKPFDVLTLAKDVRVLAQERKAKPGAFAWFGDRFRRRA